MSLDYVSCPSCGQKALPVASRCPRCGKPFETAHPRYPGPGGPPRRIPAGLIVVVAVAAILLGNSLWSGGATPPIPRSAARPGSRPAPARADPAPTPATQAAGDQADSAGPAAGPGAAAGTTVVVPEKAVPAPPVSVAPPPAATLASAPKRPAPVAGKRRVATTWVNVRATRSNRAPVVKVLQPGETVEVGLLEQGWYRVLDEGTSLGFVDGRYLDGGATTTP